MSEVNDRTIDGKDLHTEEPYFVVSNMRMNVNRKTNKKSDSIQYWERELHLEMMAYFIDKNMMTSVIHDNVMIFYKKDEIENLTQEDFKDKKYIIMGIEKHKETGDYKLDQIFKSIKICKWDIVSTYEEFENKKVEYMDEDFHVFNLEDNSVKELTERYQKAAEEAHYQAEKNCFDLTGKDDNSRKFKVKMKGDIIITDPCYLIKRRDESTRPKWEDFHPYKSMYEYPDYDEDTKTSKMFTENSKKMDEADDLWCNNHPDDGELWDEGDLSLFGFTTYLTHRTLYGDWSCHTFNADTKEVIGQFCADGGEVGVFLLDEVLKYNPDYKDYEDSKFAVTLIKNFDGEVWFEKIDDETLIVKGEGNINFFTRQTGL